jgi:hypothetical protein
MPQKMELSGRPDISVSNILIEDMMYRYGPIIGEGSDEEEDNEVGLAKSSDSMDDEK